MTKRATPPERAKLSDVARLAGVSASTVSRVLSNPDLVAEPTRLSVMEAVAHTGYRMNHAARNLRKQRTGCVVALVPNLGNPFFAKILDGMGRGLVGAGYDLLVADTRQDHGALQRFLDPSRADGIILLDGLLPVGDLTTRSRIPPVITACEWIEDSALPRVILDNREGARLAVAHLCGLGHRHVGVIGGPEENILHRARMDGVRLAAEGIRITGLPGDFTLQAGQAAAQAWQALAPADRPTAIFAFSDEMACAFLSDIQRAGVRVPDDLSVMGFDDIDLVSHLTTPLTTIRQPKREIGRKAAQIILRRIAGEDVPRTTLLEPQLMVRETTAPPRSG